MNKKVLFVASVVGHIKAFHLPYLEMFKEKGYEVYVAANRGNNEEEIPFCDKFYDIEFKRNPFNTSIFSSYRKLKSIIFDEKFDIIHCHTPVASVLTRIAARHCKNTTMIYTAHGFHFFKGAPLINWMIYYPVEKFCARYTDKLVTINSEDFERAKRFKFRNDGRAYYIPGVGIDLDRINSIVVDRVKKRKELKIPEDAFLIVSVGELNKNKNHEIVLKALAKINKLNIYYIICGQGRLKDYLNNLIKKLGLENQVNLLGYRSDIIEIDKCADMFAFLSKREGLPVSVMEAMACGLPIVCSRIRGNMDLIYENENGYLSSPNDVNAIAEIFDKVSSSNCIKENMKQKNKNIIMKFDINQVRCHMRKIYFE